MTITKLKNTLAEKIYKINDADFLNAIKVIIESKYNQDEIYKLNEVEKKKISQSNLQFKRGEGITNDEVFEKMEKWLKEK
ncbi:MAG: hypothetical protein ABI840_04095 [bacterium]